MTTTQQRLPRFKRDPEAAGSFQFTPRDLELLRQVAEHRFIKSEWLIKLVGGSRQQVLRRLNLLYHHGYLDRPHCQLDYYHQGGSRSMIYGLASRGAGRLRRDLNMPFERMDWTTRNKQVGRLFLEHTLMVSGFMAALELECRNRSDIRLIYGGDLPQPQERANRRKPFRWAVDLPGKRRVGVVPDKVFALNTTRADGVVTRMLYFIEADRGTMPIERRDLRQSCVVRKLKAYDASYLKLGSQGGRHFTVVFLTNTSERTDSIRAATKKLGLASSHFLTLHTKATPLLLPAWLAHLRR